MDREIDALRKFLDRHHRLVVLTGAGCSTASGIPAYRDELGAWAHRRPMSYAEFVGSPSARCRYWAGSLRGWPRVRDAHPSDAHRALRGLEARGRLALTVTQNVDGLHQKAGTRRVLDLHGRLDTVECLECGGHVRREDVQALLLAWNDGLAGDRGDDEGRVRPDGDVGVEPVAELRIPECRECGGVLKPAVVFFGENVPRRRVEAALAALTAADALLVVGSSLMVYSGYRFVLAARAAGKPVAAVNRGRTRADELLDLKVSGDCGALLRGALEGAGRPS